MKKSYWGLVVLLLLAKSQFTIAQAPVTTVEYFFNTDPGFGNATQIIVTPGTQLNDITFPVNITAIPAGINRMYLRSKNETGQWSITNSQLFFKSSMINTNVVKAEYFFNTDPGFGNGTNIAITPGSLVADQIINLNLNSLPIGINQLYIRSLNSAGSWSITNRFLFLKNERGDAITQIEYFYDTDPGFGKGIPVAINQANILSNYLVPVNVTGLTQGEHTLYFRTLGENGWSITNKKIFNVTTSVAAPLINVNSVTKKVNCAWNSFRISFHATGNYTQGNRFTVQLSDKNGSFANPIVIGDTLTTLSSEVYCILPSRLEDGTNYRIRVISSEQPVTGISGIDAITIHDRPNLGGDTLAHIVCQGETYNLLPLYNTGSFTTVNWNTNNLETAPVGNYRLIVSNIHGCLDTAYATVQQDVNIWTGAINTNWHEPGNWSTGKIPYEKTHVIINGTAANVCEIKDNDGMAASVQMRSGGAIALLNEKKLMIEAKCNPLPTGQ